MNEYEHMLATELPRPVPDPRFRRELLERILEGSIDAAPESVDEVGGRRIVFYVGGAVMGAAAAAIAFGAALGRRRVRTTGSDEEAA